MTDMLPREVREGLELARRSARRRKSRLRLHVGDRTYPILRFSHDGFQLDIEDAPHLRGHVDIYEGHRHLYQALIVAAAREGDCMSYEFKRSTPATDHAPLDYFRADDAPVALIPRY